jgi:hypothetical protein
MIRSRPKSGPLDRHHTQLLLSQRLLIQAHKLSPPFLGECDNGCMITNRKDHFLSPRFGQLLLLLAEDTCTAHPSVPEVWLRLFFHALRLSQCQRAAFGNRACVLSLSTRFPFSTHAGRKAQPCKEQYIFGQRCDPGPGNSCCFGIDRDIGAELAIPIKYIDFTNFGYDAAWF